jgi:Fe-S oxidoreductase
VIKAIPGVEFVEVEHNRQEGLCCGSVLTLIGEPPVAHKIGDHRLQEAVDVEAEAMLAVCPCCQFQLRVSADRMGTDMPIYDLAWFAAKGLGSMTSPSRPTMPSRSGRSLKRWFI